MRLMLLPATSWTHFFSSDAKQQEDLLDSFVWSSALNTSFTNATGAPNHLCLHNFDCCVWTSLLLDLIGGVGNSSFGSEYYATYANSPPPPKKNK